MIRAIVPERIARQWNAVALTQLTAVVASQADEIERLQVELARADDCAEFWHDQATEMQLQLCEEQGAQPGITQSGALVVVAPVAGSAL